MCVSVTLQLCTFVSFNVQAKVHYVYQDKLHYDVYFFYCILRIVNISGTFVDISSITQC